MSIRLSQAFRQGEPGDVWFKMQMTHDFWQASRAKRKKIRPIRINAAKAA
jgi:plasmid maintenance system antidote protein VapI